MAKSEPISIRLSAELEGFIEDEARRTRRSKGAVIEALASEAVKTRLFPGVAFRGEDWNRRAWVIGTALDVWQIVDAFGSFDSVDEMAAESDLTERQIRLALAYYERFAADVDEMIARNRTSLAELHEQFPTIEVATKAKA